MTTAAAAEAPPPNRPLVLPYLQLLLPLLAAHILQSIGGLIDGMWIGRLAGVRGIAAVSAFFPVFFVLLSIIIGMSAATSVLVGKAWGAGDFARCRRIASTSLAIALGIGTAVSVLGGAGAGLLMQWLGTPGDVIADATTYARMVLIAMPLTFTLWTCMALARGTGDATSPMWAMVAATAVGAVATPCLLAGWGGLPAMGLPGAVVSNLLAQVVAFAVLLWRGQRARHPLLARGLRSRDFRFDRALAREAVRIGVPASLQMLSMALAEMALLGLVNRHGSAATAAYGAATQLLTWVQFPAMCLGIAASILSAHVIGAGRAHRLPAVVAAGLAVNALVTTAFVIAAHVLAPTALRLFVQDAQVLEIGVGMMRTVGWSVVLFGWSSVLVGAMRASGTLAVPTALGVLAILCVELPAAMVLEPLWGLAGLWWAYPAGFAAMLLLQGAYCAWRWLPGYRTVPAAPLGSRAVTA